MVKPATEPTELPPLYIRERMKILRVKGEDLAERMETTAATVSRLLNGRRKMTLEWLFAFSKALNTPIASLFSPPESDRTTDPEMQLRSAMLAYGVDRDELDQVVRVVRTYVSDVDDERSEQKSPADQPQPASPRHEPAPSGKRVRQPSS